MRANKPNVLNVLNVAKNSTQFYPSSSSSSSSPPLSSSSSSSSSSAILSAPSYYTPFNSQLLFSYQDLYNSAGNDNLFQRNYYQYHEMEMQRPQDIMPKKCENIGRAIVKKQI
jgi:hypothetical protein